MCKLHMHRVWAIFLSKLGQIRIDLASAINDSNPTSLSLLHFFFFHKSSSSPLFIENPSPKSLFKSPALNLSYFPPPSISPPHSSSSCSEIFNKNPSPKSQS
eukprot:TRINITY_DN6859_c1_g1_i1.p1 TRINITY_DN6859_c1_g1~~TRINITY_DN6859_c1_g1_i1.p1  ORF type:complete len:102 (+),score=17.55 TRINITY_DN6859_c1_g1_i1:1487-1792(+)